MEIEPNTKYETKPHRLCGTNLTQYSMYGKYCTNYRGYGNGNTELGAMVEILGGNAYPFRVSEEDITEKKSSRVVGRGGE